MAVAAWLHYSADGERAVRAINRLSALVSRLRNQATLFSGPRRRSYEADINELGLVRAWSVLEAYLTSRGETILQRDLPLPVSPTDLQAHVHVAVLNDFRTWRGIEEYWKQGLGLSGASWGDLADYKELRNIIAHGLGYVRPRPGPRPYSKAMARRLANARLNPRTYFGRVPLDDADFDDFLDVVRSFILACETSVP